MHILKPWCPKWIPTLMWVKYFLIHITARFMVKFGSFSFAPLQKCSQIALVVSCSVVATLFQLWLKNVLQAILLRLCIKTEPPLMPPWTRLVRSRHWRRVVLKVFSNGGWRENFQMSCRSLKKKLCTLREPCIPVRRNECVLHKCMQLVSHHNVE